MMMMMMMMMMMRSCRLAELFDDLSQRCADLRRELYHVEWLDSFRSFQPFFWSRWRQPTWFVFNVEQLEDWESRADKQDFLAMLREDCQLAASFPVQMDARDVNVLVYRRD